MGQRFSWRSLGSSAQPKWATQAVRFFWYWHMPCTSKLHFDWASVHVSPVTFFKPSASAVKAGTCQVRGLRTHCQVGRERPPEPAIPFLKYVAVPKGGKRKNAMLLMLHMDKSKSPGSNWDTALLCHHVRHGWKRKGLHTAPLVMSAEEKKADKELWKNSWWVQSTSCARLPQIVHIPV